MCVCDLGNSSDTRIQRNANQLLWLLHGGPGTGKSHVIKTLQKDFFENVLQWQAGLDFKVVALQAVNAEALDGDTIHHALGLQPFQSRSRGKQESGPSDEAAKLVSQWKWLIIDEISMVSVQFLAELDHHLRSIMSQVSRMKVDQLGHDRPFGGLHVIFCGDFHQLDPPTGTPIASIPTAFIQKARQYAPGATEEHGQYIFWGDGEGSVQGVTELHECVRVEGEGNAWLLEVQDQFREGCLSEDNYNFMHGNATKVPGSWVNGKTLCGNSNCEKLVIASPDDIKRSASSDSWLL